MTVNTEARFADRLAFVDCETVTLDSQPGSVWEIAVMGADDEEPRVTQVRPDLSIAEPQALVVGRFADRYQSSRALPRHELIGWLVGSMNHPSSVIVGSNPQFDIAHLEAQLEGPELDAISWHYHPCDLPSLVAGATGRWPGPDGSLSLKWAATAVGVDPDCYEAHTAAGDVLLARDIWRSLS